MGRRKYWQVFWRVTKYEVSVVSELHEQIIQNGVKIKQKQSKKGFPKQRKNQSDFWVNFFKKNRALERPMVEKVESALYRGVRSGAEWSLLMKRKIVFWRLHCWSRNGGSLRTTVSIPKRRFARKGGSVPFFLKSKFKIQNSTAAAVECGLFNFASHHFGSGLFSIFELC